MSDELRHEFYECSKRLGTHVHDFSQRAALLFEKNDWKWSIGTDFRVPTVIDISYHVFNLLRDIAKEFERDSSPWVSLSAGRIRVRFTYYNNIISGVIELVPLEIRE